jgi:tetratricopeptide (TPR) repeat protein
LQVLKRIILASLFLLCSLVEIAGASPKQELQEARESFLAGEYQGSIGKLTALLYPTSRLAMASSIAEAHLLLGVSLFETGERAGAVREFEEALFLDETLSLSTSLFTTEAVKFFDETKEELRRKAKDVEETERLARKEQALNKAVENLIVIEKYRYWVNFVPFGAGQFQNGQRGKGLAFFLGEAALGGTTVALWSYQVVKYGYRGTVPLDEVDTVNTIQVLQVGSGALFIALTAWGIYDSLTNYQYQIEREADPSIIKELKDALESETDNTPTIVPTATPDGAGVSLQWEF